MNTYLRLGASRDQQDIDSQKLVDELGGSRRRRLLRGLPLPEKQEGNLSQPALVRTRKRFSERSCLL